MTESYRKKVEIAPGVHLDIKKRGIGTTVGVRAASIAFGKNGTYISAGMPGTGYYSRQKIGGKEVTPISSSASTNGQTGEFSFKQSAAGSCLFTSIAILMLLLGLAGGGFFYWMAFILFAVFAGGLISTMLQTGTSGGNSKEDLELLEAAKEELNNPHTEIEKRILQNFIDCCTLIDEMNEEEAIIEALKGSDRYKEYLPEHEQKLKEAKEKLETIQYNVDLEVTEEERMAYEDLCQKFETLLTSDKIWRMDGRQINSQTGYAVSSSVKRSETTVGVGVFDFIKSQYDVPIIKDGDVQLFFYPQFLIAAKSPTSFSVIPYSSVSLSGHKGKFNEEGYRPVDAKHVNYTWEHVNKSGGPDRRYAKNKRIPVMEYGDLTIRYADNSSSFKFSNSEALVAFADSFDDMSTRYENDAPDLISSGSTDKGDYFKDVCCAANNLYNHIKRLNRNEAVQAMLAKYDESLGQLDEIGVGEISPRLLIICLFDVIRGYEGLGHKLDLDTEEGLRLANFITRLISPEKDIVYNSEAGMRTFGREVVGPFLENFTSSVLTDYPKDKFFVIDMMRADEIDDELVSKYAILLYRFTSIIAKADGVVSEEEAKWLEHIISFATVDGGSYNGSNIRSSSKNGLQNGGMADPEEELKSLIGLASVKEEVSKLANYIKIQQMRKQRGMATVPVSCHCVFTGNPGTGKTTVARIVAKIYKNLGILKKGHLVETDRSGLVAEYVGQTAVKTNKIIDKALDGVLFIDEAYSLVQGGSNDYGTEAISTLLKRMEDDRDRLVVILAGYSNEMKQFIDSNPGLQSRFNRYIHFADYEMEDLQKMFMLNVNKNEYHLSAEAEQKLKMVLTKAIEEKDDNFGNGRFVRNLFEKTIENQATRLASIGNITNNLLAEIEAIDIPG